MVSFKINGYIGQILIGTMQVILYLGEAEQLSIGGVNAADMLTPGRIPVHVFNAGP